MWQKIADFVLKYRTILLVLLGLITVFMGYMGRSVQYSYDFMMIVPPDDEDMLYFTEFRETFGKDDNIFAIGIQDSSLFKLDKFLELAAFTKRIKQQKGIADVLSVASLQYIQKDTSQRKFQLVSLFDTLPRSQAELDSLWAFGKNIKFYENRVFNQKGANLIVISISPDVLNSKYREILIQEIAADAQKFEQKTGIDLHLGGVPYVRTTTSGMLKAELNQFLLISLGVTAFVLFLLFRSFPPVVFPLIMIGMVVVWTLGTLGIFQYKITMLTGLLPTILVVIGIPNCVYLLTKYHQEFLRYKDKKKALISVLKKVGAVTVITNLTTAIGFGVLIFTDISVLSEFGIVASINIAATFLITIIYIPAVFSFLPSPQEHHVKYLEFKATNRLLALFATLATEKRKYVYGATALLILISGIGMYQIKAVAYMVEELPEESDIRRDLTFFESNFEGVMPLEIIVDLGKPNGVRLYKNQQKIEEIENFIDSLEQVSVPTSMVSFLKAANQAFFNQNPTSYTLPSKRESQFVYSYLGKGKDASSGMLKSFVDSSGQKMRISLKVADMGSVKMDSLIKQVINPRIAQIVEGSDIKVKVTGTTYLFVKGNKYLIANLKSSLVLACLLVAFTMGLLFRNLRMVLITALSNMVPLIITAGLMGYLGIPLKPSTALIFSIVFGIAVDDSIHFLAKYRQEVAANNYNRPQALIKSLIETGTSMIYTSLVLFSGFVIFVGSNFGGTVALGSLTSTTLLIAMFTNLILLPALISKFDTFRAEDENLSEEDLNIG